jgi:hypothetical protein
VCSFLAGKEGILKSNGYKVSYQYGNKLKNQDLNSVFFLDSVKECCAKGGPEAEPDEAGPDLPGPDLPTSRVPICHVSLVGHINRFQRLKSIELG